MPTPSIEFSLLRQGKPDFLDLPWHLPLSHWEGHCDRLETIPRGVGRHPVVFVNYEGNLFALKELPNDLAVQEYDALVEMESRHLPVVRPVGHVTPRSDSEPRSVLITRHLNRSLPYQMLFSSDEPTPDRERMLDAMAGLLVQLHLAGIFWGDCSLANTLFRRDAGALQAYLVDAETTEIHDDLSHGMREHDLDIMEENVEGALADLAAMRGLEVEPGDVGGYIRSRYLSLWEEINREETFDPSERWKIHQRIRALNDLGFSVREIRIREGDTGSLQLRAVVADRHYHHDLLYSLTGMDAEELQARQLLNEIQEHRFRLSEETKRSVSLSAAAFHWQFEVFQPFTAKLLKEALSGRSDIDLYCELLDHKWFLSERAQRNVGHQVALEDYVERVLKHD
ncbi:MAG: DUF4032 domain-containing protein [bacterium]